MMNPKQLKRLERLKAEHQKVLAGRVIKYQALLSKCEELTADIKARAENQEQLTQQLADQRTAMQGLVEASKNMDWQQAVLNGGRPCFFLLEKGRFCGRAQRWYGHTDKDKWPEHRFMSLDAALAAAAKLREGK